MGRGRFDRRAWNQVTHMGAKQDIPGLVKVMRESLDDERRSYAARLLGELSWKATTYEDWICYCICRYAKREVEKEGKKVIPALVALLSDPNPKYPKEAAEILESMGWGPSSESEKIAYYIANGWWIKLGTMGPNAVEPFIRQFKVNEEWSRAKIIQAMSTIKDPRVAPFIITALADPHRRVRESAAESLIPFGKIAVEPLIDALNTSQDGTKVSIIQALEKIRDERAVEPLMKYLSDPLAGVRNAALSALIKFGVINKSGQVIQKGKAAEMRGDEQGKAPGKIRNDEQDKAPAKIRSDEQDKAPGKIRNDEQDKAPAKMQSDEQDGVAEKMQSDPDKLHGTIGKASSKRVKKTTGKKTSLKKSIEYSESKTSDHAKKDSIENSSTSKQKQEANIIITQLLDSLKDPSALKRIAAADTLGKIDDPRIIQPLCSALKDVAPDVRKSAAQALGKLRDESAVEPLISCLKDSYASVRSTAIASLMILQNSKAVKPLHEMLSDPDIKIRKKAIEALDRFHEGNRIGSLIKALRGPDSGTENANSDPSSRYGRGKMDRTDYIRIGGYWRHTPEEEAKISLIKSLENAIKRSKNNGDGEFNENNIADAVDILIENLKELNPSIVSAASSSLINIGEEAVVPLGSFIKDSIVNHKKIAIEIIGSIRHPKAIPYLIETLKDDSLMIREASTTALGKIGTEACINPLRIAAKDSEEGVRNLAIISMGNLDIIQFWDVLVEATKDPDPKVRISALNAVFNRKNEESFELVRNALRDEDPNVRKRAVTLIFRYSTIKSEKVDIQSYLIEKLDDSSNIVVESAIEVLGGVKDERIVEKASQLLSKHPDKKIRSSAAFLIKCNINLNGMQSLFAALNDPDYEVQRKVINMLEDLHDPSAIQPLFGMIKEGCTMIMYEIINALLSYKEVNPYDILRKFYQVYSDTYFRTKIMNHLAIKGIQIDWSKV